MKEAAQLIEAILKLYEALGPAWSVIVIFVIFGVPLYIRYRRDKALQDAYREVINEKENQIQRLADDNREYRNFFWRTRGLTEDEILDLRKQSDIPRTPLTSPPGKQQQGGRRKKR